MNSSKKRKLYFEDDVSQTKDSTSTQFDWSLCILCQERKDERLQCPAESKRTNSGAGYLTLEKDLLGFKEHGSWPISVDAKHLDDGDGIGMTIARHSAKWHPSCRLKCSSSRLARIQKVMSKGSSEVHDSQTDRYTRRRSSNDSSSVPKCFFCEEPATKSNPLHESSTEAITRRVYKCAVELNDQKLIAKLSAGDMVPLEAQYHAKCLARLYNSTRNSGEEALDSARIAHGIALAELVEYIEEKRLDDESVIPVFRLSKR